MAFRKRQNYKDRKNTVAVWGWGGRIRGIVTVALERKQADVGFVLDVKMKDEG